MCFSAEASFTVAAVVGSVGCYLVYKFWNDKRRFLAMIPLFFAIQQFCEGVVWVALNTNHYPDFFSSLAQYTYMFFAYLFWPIWMPFAFMWAEREPLRRAYIALFVFLGSLIFIFDGYQLLVYGAENVKIMGRNITYGESPLLRQLGYLFVTVSAYFISSIPKMWIIGTGLILAFIVSELIFPHAFASVWCFTAAIVTAGLFFFLKK